MSNRVTVIGGGSWGTTLAVLAVRAGREAILVVRDAETASMLRRERVNARYLPDLHLPPGVEVASDPNQSVRDASVVLLAVPTSAMRETAQAIAADVTGRVVVSAAKGLEQGSLLRMTEVLRQELPSRASVAALSGPNLAREIAAGKPAATVVASGDPEAAMLVASLLQSARFRVYTSGDPMGVEIGGSLKNVVAIGAGIADGLGTGDNAKAALMTRGLAEIARLGVALGANPLTFAGLSGLGDLVATCASPHSRNRSVGQGLAEGRTLEEVTRSLGQVAEGVATTRAAVELGRRHGVELPIAEQVEAVLYEGRAPEDAITRLMGREQGDELRGLRGSDD